GEQERELREAAEGDDFSTEPRGADAEERPIREERAPEVEQARADRDERENRRGRRLGERAAPGTTREALDQEPEPERARGERREREHREQRRVRVLGARGVEVRRQEVRGKRLLRLVDRGRQRVLGPRRAGKEGFGLRDLHDRGVI